MPDAHESDLGPDPNVNRAPLRTGNKPDTQADRENAVFRYPEWVVDRISATALMLVLVAVILGVGGFALWFVLNARLW
ncbi:MAG: hypothetical protein WBC44_15955 [Planctomycetaceae bacterium]